MVAIALLEQIANGLKAVVDLAKLLAKFRAERQKDKEDAAKAILGAATKTRAYLADVREGRPKDRKRELVLRDLWMDAHMTVLRVDWDLAEKCLIKADYWSDKRLWTDPRYRDIPVDLDTVIDEYTVLAREVAPRRARRSRSRKATRGRAATAASGRSASAGERTLHLTIEPAHFKRIVSGTKPVENRREDVFPGRVSERPDGERPDGPRRAQGTQDDQAHGSSPLRDPAGEGPGGQERQVVDASAGIPPRPASKPAARPLPPQAGTRRTA